MNSEVREISVFDRPEQNRYEVTSAGTLAGFLTYRAGAGRLDLVHTEILPEYEGQGLAAQLVARALDDVRPSGRRIVPSCSYVAKFVQRHPQYEDLVAPRA